MAKLTEKQQRFANEYIRLGDGMRSYIDKRLEEIKSKTITDQEEVIFYLTSIMRGEYKEQVLKDIGMGEQMIADMGVPANQSIKASERIDKRYGIWTEKHEVKDTTPRFVEDVSDDDD